MDEEFNTDEALLSLGRLKKWQIFSYIYMSVILASSACFAMLSVVFIGKFILDLMLNFWLKQRFIY